MISTFFRNVFFSPVVSAPVSDHSTLMSETFKLHSTLLSKGRKYQFKRPNFQNFMGRGRGIECLRKNLPILKHQGLESLREFFLGAVEWLSWEGKEEGDYKQWRPECSRRVRGYSLPHLNFPTTWQPWSGQPWWPGSCQCNMGSSTWEMEKCIF